MADHVITAEQIDQYVADCGNKCPCCGSDNLEGDSFEAGSSEVWQNICCLGCGAVWQDVYRLTGIAEAPHEDTEIEREDGVPR